MKRQLTTTFVCLPLALAVLLAGCCCSSKSKQTTTQPKPAPADAQARAVTLQNIPRLIWIGDLDAAERSARAILEADPENNAAYYYLSVIKERRQPKPPRKPSTDFLYPTLPPKPLRGAD